MAAHSPSGRQWNNNLHVLLNFYTDDPKRIPPETGTETSTTRPYWNVVRSYQENDLFLEGMLLKSLDREARHPYIHYVVYNNPPETDLTPGLLTANSRQQAGWFGGITASQGFYRELYTFVDHQTALLPKRPQSPQSAYIISAFKAIGCIKELDKLWSYWSGADLIVETIPSILRLQRLTFHKVKGDVTSQVYAYVLMCELGDAITHKNKALEFVETLNDRQCGLSSLYAVDHFI